MKKNIIFTIACLIGIVVIQACGESEAERQAREQARLDSIRTAQQADIARQMQAVQDSIDAANASEEPMVEEVETMAEGFSEDGMFAVQVGAWRSQEKADAYITNWADREYPNAYTVKVGDETNGDVWFRVRIGFFETEEAAEQFGSQLAEETQTGYWVSKVER
ncbi:MAG: SPOR domain-containing protein [Bacteroidota bacterium]